MEPTGEGEGFHDSSCLCEGVLPSPTTDQISIGFLEMSQEGREERQEEGGERERMERGKEPEGGHAG